MQIYSIDNTHTYRHRNTIKEMRVMKDFLKPSEVAKILGMHKITILRYIKTGKLKAIRTKTNRLLIPKKELDKLLSQENSPKRVVIYCRVSTQKQKKYLENQIELCKQFATAQGLFIDEIITDIASSFNFKRKGLVKLIQLLLNNEVSDIIIYSKDRLSRLSFDLFQNITDLLGVKIHIIDKSDSLHSEEQIKDYTEELISFIHYITSKIYGSRSYKKNKL